MLARVVTQHIGPLASTELVAQDRIRKLRKLVPEDIELWPSPEYVVKFGVGAGCVLEIAAECQADLIVLGVHPAPGHIAAASESTAMAHAVVSLASCPVLTVRG
jgi:nucleotide-binding universal stress UspA family protein